MIYDAGMFRTERFAQNSTSPRAIRPHIVEFKRNIHRCNFKIYRLSAARPPPHGASKHQIWEVTYVGMFGTARVAQESSSQLANQLSTTLFKRNFHRCHFQNLPSKRRQPLLRTAHQVTPNSGRFMMWVCSGRSGLLKTRPPRVPSDPISLYSSETFIGATSKFTDLLW